LFQYRQQLRHWAARVLLLWLFGLAAGVANACIAVPSHHAGGHPSLPVTSSGHVEFGEDASVAGDDPVHAQFGHHQQNGVLNDQGTPGAESCKSFCDKAADLVPQQKSSLDDSNGFALAPPVIQVVVPSPIVITEEVWLPRREGVLAPPIPIAFLRLAL